MKGTCNLMHWISIQNILILSNKSENKLDIGFYQNRTTSEMFPYVYISSINIYFMSIFMFHTLQK